MGQIKNIKLHIVTDIKFQSVKNVWYTILKTPKTWQEKEKECRGVEPGRTTLASIKSGAEQIHLRNLIKGEQHMWIGGVRVAENMIYWYKNKGASIQLETLNVKFFHKNEPCCIEQTCLQMYSDMNGEWDDDFCHNHKPALCELRC